METGRWRHFGGNSEPVHLHTVHGVQAVPGILVVPLLCSFVTEIVRGCLRVLGGVFDRVPEVLERPLRCFKRFQGSMKWFQDRFMVDQVPVGLIGFTDWLMVVQGSLKGFQGSFKSVPQSFQESQE